MKAAQLYIGAGLAGLLLLAYLASKGGQVWTEATDTVGGIVTGDNALTRNATNAQGEAVNAYQGAGFVGTAGAAANAASGGWLASVGGWIGRSIYDLANPDPVAILNATKNP